MKTDEVARVLALISAHYWQTPGVADRNIDLMIGTWQLVLADVPWNPYGEKALEWWLKHQRWPPQAAELRARARELMRDEREARENAEQLKYLSAPRRHDTSLPGLIHEWNRRRKLGLHDEELTG